MNSFNQTRTKKLALVGSALAASLLLSACDHDDDDAAQMLPPPTPAPMPVVTSYDVTVVNLTSAQPMSPVTAVLHNEGTLWTLGESASDAIENLAESGSNEQLLALDVVMASGAGEGILMPGATQTFTVSGEDITAGLFSLATMLVNTNDAFTGINAMDVSSLSVGESISRVTSSYDSGTEANSETAATIPGPAGGGEGFNAARDDVDFVSMHSGVVTMDDGLMNSALSFHHRFDNPTLRVTVTRTE